MRRWLSASLGFVATILGTLIVLPRINETIWRLQLVLNEFPYSVTALGLFAAFKRPRTGIGTAFGLYGAALSLMPLVRVPAAIDDMNTMMREGLGTDYESQIAPEMKKRLASARLSLAGVAGFAYNKNHVSTLYDIPFSETPSRPLKLDVYRPLLAPGDGGKLYPAVIVIHGGSWAHGDKGGYFAPHNRYLASQGYVVFDVQYRFTTLDQALWPTQLDDIRAAIRWVKAHAAGFNIDPDRLALLGRSAGAQLALQAAYRACDDAVDTQVKAVIAIYGPTNLRLTDSTHNERVVALLAGKSYEVPENYADASPLDFARDGLPATLLSHGTMDKLVSPVHSELLLNRLCATDTPVVLLRVPWGRHGFDVFMNGLGAQLTQYHTDRFLAWSLYSQ